MHCLHWRISGVCAGGLSCLIKFDNPEEEQVRGGVCVPQESPKCPRSTDKPQKEGVNCRTGQFGILAEALYCPTPLRQGGNSKDFCNLGDFLGTFLGDFLI